jgi:hypothetical protein
VLILLKRLSTEIPKNGEWRFSSSIPRRKRVVLQARSASIAVWQTVWSRWIAGTVEEHSGRQVYEKPNPANWHKNAGGKPGKINRGAETDGSSEWGDCLVNGFSS